MSKVPLLLVLYRVLAVFIVTLPIVVNLISQGDIVTSLLFVPLICTIFASLFILFDGLLVNYLSKKQNDKQNSFKLVVSTKALSSRKTAKWQWCCKKLNDKTLDSAA